MSIAFSFIAWAMEVVESWTETEDAGRQAMLHPKPDDVRS